MSGSAHQWPTGASRGPAGLPPAPPAPGGPPLPHFVPTSTAQEWPATRVLLNVLGHHALAAPVVGVLAGASSTYATAEGLLSGGPDSLIATGLPLGLVVLAGGFAGALLAQPVGAVVGLVLGITAMATRTRTTPSGAGAVAAVTSPFVLSPLLAPLTVAVWLLIAVPASLAAFAVVRHVVGMAQRETAEARRVHAATPLTAGVGAHTHDGPRPW